MARILHQNDGESVLHMDMIAPGLREVDEYRVDKGPGYQLAAANFSRECGDLRTLKSC